MMKQGLLSCSSTRGLFRTRTARGVFLVLFLVLLAVVSGCVSNEKAPLFECPNGQLVVSESDCPKPVSADSTSSTTRMRESSSMSSSTTKPASTSISAPASSSTTTTLSGVVEFDCLQAEKTVVSIANPSPLAGDLYELTARNQNGGFALCTILFSRNGAPYRTFVSYANLTLTEPGEYTAAVCMESSRYCAGNISFTVA